MLSLLLCLTLSANAQDTYEEGEAVFQTFRHTRVINHHSIETLPANKLDFRVVHRFGDLAGDAGGWPTFYGLESASDIAIGFEYGITDNIMIGINRTKGAGPLGQNLNGLLKLKLFTQEYKGNLPFSMAVTGIGSYSTMAKSSVPGRITSFAKPSHRLVYHMGVHVARKFSDRLSLQASGLYTFRNVVEEGDVNDLIAVAAGLRLQVTKSFGLILDATLPLLSDQRTNDDYTTPLAIAFEFDTSGGHIFQLNFSNSRGISETDFIPYTTSDWREGEFRFGFTISRLFSL